MSTHVVRQQFHPISIIIVHWLLIGHQPQPMSIHVVRQQFPPIRTQTTYNYPGLMASYWPARANEKSVFSKAVLIKPTDGQLITVQAQWLPLGQPEPMRNEAKSAIIKRSLDVLLICVTASYWSPTANERRRFKAEREYNFSRNLSLLQRRKT